MNGTNKISLVKNTISNKEVDQLIDWLATYPQLTQGPKVKEFEAKWSNFLGAKFSTFVNSGSSALLLAYYAIYLSTGRQNIIVPALSWATDLAPVIQFGFTPILCDCNLDDLSLDLNHLELLLKSNPDCVVCLVSVLGLVPQMDKILELKEKYSFILLEDVCESFGSEFNNKKLGSFGDISVFSLFYGHHLSTIEGGMICTNNEDLNDVLKMIRAHGWDRELSEDKQKVFRSKHQIDDFSASYTFYYPGFNVRGTDLQATIGIQQLDKAQDVIFKRNKNYNFLKNSLELAWKPKDSPDKFVSNFCYPIISESRAEIIKILVDNNIECRPLICGSMGLQPFYKNQFGELNLPNVSLIDKQGMYIPNNPDLSQGELGFMVEKINLATRI
jgi:CDP-6-deoxy-D-xylo-4-hexulose-3-dehydrase